MGNQSPSYNFLSAEIKNNEAHPQYVHIGINHHINSSLPLANYTFSACIKLASFVFPKLAIEIWMQGAKTGNELHFCNFCQIFKIRTVCNGALHICLAFFRIHQILANIGIWVGVERGRICLCTSQLRISCKSGNGAY